MARVVSWVVGNLDGLIALVLAVTIGVLNMVDVAGGQQVQAVTLIVLGVLAAALLRDRGRRSSVEQELREELHPASAALRELPASFAYLRKMDDVLDRTRTLLEDQAMVRVLWGREVNEKLAQAWLTTDRWIFKGGTGTYIRAVTLPECVENARKNRRNLFVRLEILDPTNEQVCERYARFRRSLSQLPDATGELWTVERTRKESFATILAAYWYRQRYGLLDVEVGLSSTMTTFRWDLSSSYVIMTQEDPRAAALMTERGQYYYDRWGTELAASHEQARRVPIGEAKAVPLSDQPSVGEARRLFASLNLPLPNTFSDRSVADIIRKAIRPEDPYR